ncbi:MAG: hypothetical protein AAGH57_08650 [Pseudomonadota bacterium]
MRWSLLFGLALLHAGALYLLARAFAPDIARSLDGEVVAAFDIAPTPTNTAVPPENRSEPDQGEQGSPAKTAIAAPVSAPRAAVPLPEPESLPPAASTDAAPRSGGGEAGQGTGAAGEGLGTGSGLGGSGPGGVAITRPEHISGAINNASDYPTPPGGREERRGTEVIVRVIVGVDGRARDCSIYRASPDPAADLRTCELVIERLGFRPARDANGDPVDAPFYWRQRWF